MWDAENGKQLLTLSGHSDPVSGVAFNPDGRRLATVSDDHTERIIAKCLVIDSGRFLTARPSCTTLEPERSKNVVQVATNLRKFRMESEQKGEKRLGLNRCAVCGSAVAAFHR